MKTFLIAALSACLIASPVGAQTAPAGATNMIVPTLVYQEIQARGERSDQQAKLLRGRVGRSESQLRAAVRRAEDLARDNAVYRSAVAQLFPGGTDMSPREAASVLADFFLQLAALHDEVATAEAALRSEVTQVVGYREAVKRQLVNTLQQTGLSIAGGRLEEIQLQLDGALDLAQQLALDLDDEGEAAKAEGRDIQATFAVLAGRSATARREYAAAAALYGQAAAALAPIDSGRDRRLEYLIDQSDALFMSGSLEDLTQAIDVETSGIAPLSDTPTQLAWVRNAVAVYQSRIALTSPPAVRRERMLDALAGFEVALDLIPSTDRDRDFILVNRADALLWQEQNATVDPDRFQAAVEDLESVVQHPDSPSWGHASIKLAAVMLLRAQDSRSAQTASPEPSLQRAADLYRAVQQRYPRAGSDGFWEMAESGLATVDFVRGQKRRDRRQLIGSVDRMDAAIAGWAEQDSRPPAGAFLLKAQALLVLARLEGRNARRRLMEADQAVAQGLLHARDASSRESLQRVRGQIEEALR